MRNMLRKWLGIDALEARAEAAERERNRLSKVIDKKVAELDRLTRKDCDLGMRGNSTIILTGVYRGRGYVKFYDVPQDHFEALVREFQDRRKDHLIRNLDAPPMIYGAFDI